MIDIKVVAIVCITILAVVALYLGYDNVILATIIGVIAGIAGYTAGRLLPQNNLNKSNSEGSG